MRCIEGFETQYRRNNEVFEKVKISVNHIPFNGLEVEEEIDSRELELETQDIKFRNPVKVKANISKITNAVAVNLDIKASYYTDCSRCLEEVNVDFNKALKLNFQIVSVNQIIDLNTDIREEIILEYPMQPLCKPDCKGLCKTCGKNLNESACGCNSRN